LPSDSKFLFLERVKFNFLGLFLFQQLSLLLGVPLIHIILLVKKRPEGISVHRALKENSSHFETMVDVFEE